MIRIVQMGKAINGLHVSGVILALWYRMLICLSARNMRIGVIKAPSETLLILGEFRAQTIWKYAVKLTSLIG